MRSYTTINTTQCICRHVPCRQQPLPMALTAVSRTQDAKHRKGDQAKHSVDEELIEETIHRNLRVLLGQQLVRRDVGHDLLEGRGMVLSGCVGLE